MSYPLAGNPHVLAAAKLPFTGITTPFSWFDYLRGPTGNADILAVLVLGEIVYRYRPLEVFEDGAAAPRWEKRFSEDLWRIDYADLAKRFGVNDERIRKAVKFLRERGLIDLHLRVVDRGGLRFGNVPYVAPHFDRIFAVTVPPESGAFPSFPPGEILRYDPSRPSPLQNGELSAKEGVSAPESIPSPRQSGKVSVVAPSLYKEANIPTNTPTPSSRARGRAGEDEGEAVVGLNTSGALALVVEEEVRVEAGTASQKAGEDGLLPIPSEENFDRLIAWTKEQDANFTGAVAWKQASLIRDLLSRFDLEDLKACYLAQKQNAYWRSVSWKTVSLGIGQYTERKRLLQEIESDADVKVFVGIAKEAWGLLGDEQKGEWYRLVSDFRAQGMDLSLAPDFGRWFEASRKRPPARNEFRSEWGRFLQSRGGGEAQVKKLPASRRVVEPKADCPRCHGAGKVELQFGEKTRRMFCGCMRGEEF